MNQMMRTNDGKTQVFVTNSYSVDIEWRGEELLRLLKKINERFLGRGCVKSRLAP